MERGIFTAAVFGLGSLPFFNVEKAKLKKLTQYRNPPLYTPLHKDPNPNIFTQHLSSKVIRLMRPEIGLALFSKIQSQLGTNSSASFRGDEMMEGPEYLALKKAVWDDKLNMEHYEAHVQPGESFFIPKGWWHSLKSYGKDLNISSNWWFR